ncbi:MAG: transcription antitermination factor NusB [Psychrobacter sp.]|nr:transcription antitermination factor NusB [Psychrobacter sp.]
MSTPHSAKDEETTFDISESAYKTTHTAVRKARRFALQGLYEWLMTDRRFEQTGHREWKSNAPHDIAARTRATNAMHTVHIGYYHELMRDIPEQVAELDALIDQHLDRMIDVLDTVEHAILLIGVYELKNRLEIPYKVVIDEAMKLNTHFGATDAHKLINAVLDKLAPELRAIEVQADAQTPKPSKTVKKAKPIKPIAEYDEPLADEPQATSSANSTAAEAKVHTANSSEAKTDDTSTPEPTRAPKPRIGRKTGQTVTRNHKAATISADTTDTQPLASDAKDLDSGRQSAASVISIETEAADTADSDLASQDNPTPSLQGQSIKEALSAAGLTTIDGDGETEDLDPPLGSDIDTNTDVVDTEATPDDAINPNAD